MLPKTRIYRDLCDPTSYAKGIEDLQERVAEVDATVGCTWPPTLSGRGFSAFAATASIDGDCDALVVVFRGTATVSELGGLYAFAPWVKTLKKVGHWNCRKQGNTLRAKLAHPLMSRGLLTSPTFLHSTIGAHARIHKKV